MPNEKFVTLRRLEPVELPDNWITLNEMTCVRNAPVRRYADARFVEVSPIPEGYEVCDLMCATKVLIGETWVERMSGAFTVGGLQLWPFRIEGLGVLAIRPIPEPVQPPLTGEVRVGVASLFGVTNDEFGLVCFAPGLIGKTIRWEVVKDGGK